MIPMIGEYMRDVFQDEENWDFYVQFFTDAISIAIEKWILEKEPMLPERFIFLMRSCLWADWRKKWYRRYQNKKN